MMDIDGSRDEIPLIVGVILLCIRSIAVVRIVGRVGVGCRNTLCLVLRWWWWWGWWYL